MLLPAISTLEDNINEEVELAANINEECCDSEVKNNTLDPLSEVVVLNEAVLNISLPFAPSKLKYTELFELFFTLNS